MARETDKDRKRRRVQAEQSNKTVEQIQQEAGTPEPTPLIPAPPVEQGPPRAVDPLLQASPSQPPLHTPLQAASPIPGVPAAPPVPQAPPPAVAVGIPIGVVLPGQSGAPRLSQAHSVATSSEVTEAATGNLQAPVLQDLVQHVLDSQRPAAQSFYLVVLPEDGHPKLEQFDTVTAMIAHIRLLVDATAETSVFPFVGNFMPITKGPYRFLRTPYGALPLFKVPDPEDLAVAEHGYVGPPEPALPIPKANAQPALPAVSPGADADAAAEVLPTPSADPDYTPTFQGDTGG